MVVKWLVRLLLCSLVCFFGSLTFRCKAKAQYWEAEAAKVKQNAPPVAMPPLQLSWEPGVGGRLPGERVRQAPGVAVMNVPEQLMARSRIQAVCYLCATVGAGAVLLTVE